MTDPAVIDVQQLAAELAEHLQHGITSPLLDAGQAATLLNVPESWIRAEARAGRIPHVTLGRYVRFDRDELTAWTDGRKQGPRPRGRQEGAR